MSHQDALILSGQRHMLHARAQELLDWETAKGTRTQIANQPLRLEPKYVPIYQLHPQDLQDPDDGVLADPSYSHELVLLEAWIPSVHGLEWTRAERFVRQASHCNHRVIFEISGNKNNIRLAFIVHETDADVVIATARAEYAACELVSQPLLASKRFVGGEMIFCDVHPQAPYSHRFTPPEQLEASPLESALGVLATFPKGVRGFVQIVAEPAVNDWHANVRTLIAMEFLSRQVTEMGSTFRHAQQTPGGDLHEMSTALETKAHNDKPFFFAAVRVGIEYAPAMNDGPTRQQLRLLSGFLRLLQVGGRPLLQLSDVEYRGCLGEVATWEMLSRGLSYRPGFLVNSEELTGLIHLPGGTLLKDRELPIELLDMLVSKDERLQLGTRIGESRTAGNLTQVCIPDDLRSKGAHIIGIPGKGKSVLLQHMILSDIQRGHGLVFLDPHGDLAEDVLNCVPQEQADRVVYLDMGDPEWIPLWNPLTTKPGQDLSRTADEMVSSIKSIVQHGHWGARMEHLLKHGFFAMLHLEDVSHYHLAELLKTRKHSTAERETLRHEVLSVVDDATARSFWQKEFDSYQSADFSPVQNKLSKLLMSGGAVGKMLAQTQNRLDLGSFMDSGQALIVNLSGIGGDARRVVGSFMFMLLHMATLNRADQAKQDRRPFQIYADEAHVILPEALEQIMDEARKFKVGLILAHQRRLQFTTAQANALANAAISIMFAVNPSDARVFARELYGKVKEAELNEQGIGEAICRIDNEIVRIKTSEPPRPSSPEVRERIISRSRDLYCVRADESKSRSNVSRRMTAVIDEYPPVEQTQKASGYGEFT
jgi:hypothetical protein